MVQRYRVLVSTTASWDLFSQCLSCIMIWLRSDSIHLGSSSIRKRKANQQSLAVVRLMQVERSRSLVPQEIEISIV